MYVVILITNYTYEEIEKRMIEKEIEIRPMFYSVINHKHLENIDIKLLNSNKQDREVIIMIPSSLDISKEEQEKVINTLSNILI